MSEEIPVQDVLFQDLVKDATSACFTRCVRKPKESLGSKEKKCIKDCVGRYVECRRATLNYIQHLSNSEV